MKAGSMFTSKHKTKLSRTFVLKWSDNAYISTEVVTVFTAKWRYKYGVIYCEMERDAMFVLQIIKLQKHNVTAVAKVTKMRTVNRCFFVLFIDIFCTRTEVVIKTVINSGAN